MWTLLFLLYSLSGFRSLKKPVQIYNAGSENVSIGSYYYWIWNNVRNECILLADLICSGTMISYTILTNILHLNRSRTTSAKKRHSGVRGLFFRASYLPRYTMSAMRSMHEYHIIPNLKIKGLTHHSISPALCLRGSMFFHGDSVPRLPSLQEKHDKSCSTCQAYPSTIIPICTSKLIGM